MSPTRYQAAPSRHEGLHREPQMVNSEKLEPTAGLEPAAASLRMRCTTIVLCGRKLAPGERLELPYAALTVRIITLMIPRNTASIGNRVDKNRRGVRARVSSYEPEGSNFWFAVRQPELGPLTMRRPIRPSLVSLASGHSPSRSTVTSRWSPSI